MKYIIWYRVLVDIRLNVPVTASQIQREINLM